MRPASAVPLCVDLDGTLIKSDLLAESLLLSLKAAPASILLWPVWLLRGRAAFKRQVASRVALDASSLPYDAEVLDFLKAEKKAGRKLVLATASDRRLAEAVARHVGLFDEVVATDGSVNLSGPDKLAALKERYKDGFDYAGDSCRDRAVWSGCRKAIVVRCDPSLASGAGSVERVFAVSEGRWKAVLRALRPHQWAKNLLLLVPLITSHEIVREEALLPTLLAVAAFSLCASAVYVFNDLLDLPSDRAHASKRARPLASGELPILWAPALIAALLAAAGLLAATLPSKFAWVLAGYGVATLAYSLRLKDLLLVDVFCLAGLYTVRILAGHAVTGIPLSAWLLAFSMFVFLSLALLKRHAEVVKLPPGGHAAGRDYLASDAAVLLTLGASSGYLSVLVMALYINSEQVVRLYRTPALLWLICPVLLYVISRLWLLAWRGRVDEDPVLFALKDKSCWASAAAVLAVVAAAAR